MGLLPRVLHVVASLPKFLPFNPSWEVAVTHALWLGLLQAASQRSPTSVPGHFRPICIWMPSLGKPSRPPPSRLCKSVGMKGRILYAYIDISWYIHIYIYIIIYCISFGVWLEHIPVTFGHFGARFCCHQAPIRGLRSSTSTECHWAAPPHRLVGSTLGATQQGKDQNCLKTHLLDGFREKNVHPGPIL